MKKSVEGESDKLKRICQDIQMTRKDIEAMLEKAERSPGLLQAAEARIPFRRQQLPPLLAKWILLQKSYDLECAVMESAGEGRKQVLLKQLREAAAFFDKHRVFIQYFLGEDDSLDKESFGGDGKAEEELLVLDRPFLQRIPAGSLRAAYLLAYREMAQLTSEAPGEPVESRSVTTKASDIDLIELILFIWCSSMILIDGKVAAQDFVAQWFQKLLGRPVGDVGNRVNEIRTRKSKGLKITAMYNDYLAYIDRLPRDKPGRSA